LKGRDWFILIAPFSGYTIPFSCPKFFNFLQMMKTCL
jgi:hypothetical protein